MINKTLKSGRKVIIKEMSLDDIDYCKDLLQVMFSDGKAQTVIGLNHQKTEWIRKGLGGGDFKEWPNPGVGNAPDNVIRQLKDSEKDELLGFIQEAQTLGE